MQRIYFKYLDSLRFFAFMAVFIAHAGILFPVAGNWFYAVYRNIISHGAYGVNFFFVLSGFLITFLLLTEKKKTGDINIKVFYMKRVLRIWPLYFIVFIVSIFVLPFVVRLLGAAYVAGDMSTFPNLGMELEGQGFWWFFLFIGNFFRAYDFGLTPFALGVLWSVCVEEQFYLIWPWIVKKLKDRYVFYVALLFFALSLIYKAIHINDANIAYYSTLSVGLDLAMGCALGFLYFTFEPELRRVWSLAKNIILHPQTLRLNSRSILRKTKAIGYNLVKDMGKGRIALSVILFAAVLVIYIGNIMYVLRGSDSLVYDALRLAKRPIIDIAFAILLLYFLIKKSAQEMVINDESADISNKKTLFSIYSYLGKISYGLYGYHAICMILVVAIFNYFGMGPNDVTVLKFILIFFISFTLTVTASHFSYKYLEAKFLALKSRFLKKPKSV